jgi:predicted transcriptional regulator
MVSQFKNARHKLFCSQMEAMRECGYRPADVARMLNKSPGAISQYQSGYTTPSDTVMELLDRIVDEKLKTDTEREIVVLNEKLEALQRMSPADYEVAKNTIEMVYERLTSRLVTDPDQTTEPAFVNCELETATTTESVKEAISKVKTPAKTDTESGDVQVVGISTQTFPKGSFAEKHFGHKRPETIRDHSKNKEGAYPGRPRRKH